MFSTRELATNVSFSGRVAAAGDSAGQVSLFDLGSAQVIARFDGHSQVRNGRHASAALLFIIDVVLGGDMLGLECVWEAAGIRVSGFFSACMECIHA